MAGGFLVSSMGLVAAMALGYNMGVVLNDVSPSNQGNTMPTISIFYGIKISINYNDHHPPHFHAEYIDPLP